MSGWCHTYEWFKTHTTESSPTWMGHATLMKEPKDPTSSHPHTGAIKWIMSYIRMNESCYIYEWVVSHCSDTVCYTHKRSIKTYEWVVSHIPRSDNTHGLPHIQKRDNTHEQVFYTHKQAGTSELTSSRPRTRTHTYAHEHTHTHIHTHK